MRLNYINIVKAILIVLIVFGHKSSICRELIYSFHVPSFFVLSGLFVPDLKSKSKFDFVKSKVYSLVIPYVSYLSLIGLLYYGFDMDFWLKAIVGGRALTGVFAPFWFISVLFFTLLLYVLLEKLNYVLKIILLIFFYVFASLQSNFIFEEFSIIYIPFCLDVSFMSIIYLYIGKLFEPIFLAKNIRPVIMVVYVLSSFLFFMFLMLALNNLGINYNYDMKYAVYSLPILNLIIPTVAVVFLINLGRLFEKQLKCLNVIGEASLTIMFLHLVVLEVMKKEHTIIAIICATLIPIVIYLLFQRFLWTRRLFLGKWK